MLTLLGSLLGFLSSTFPEFLKLFRDSQDRKHELAILDRQMEQQRLGHSQRLEEIQIVANVAESQALYSYAVSGGLNPRKSGGGKWWRNMVTESGGHLWRRILVAAFGAECATNSKGPVRGPCCWRGRFVVVQNGNSGSKSSSDSLVTRCSRSRFWMTRP